MKALIISDIHANLPALEAVLYEEKKFDICLFLGDVVDYGPNPKECISIVKEIADYSVIGNHDNALAFNVDCNCMGTFREYSIETRKWHSKLLNEEDKSFLKSLPVLNKAHFDEQSFFMAHASPKGNIFKYIQPDEMQEEVIELTEEFVLLGHTHIQFMKRINDSIVVNPGSVGLARDGGKACYAVYENREIILKRIDYDVNKTVDELMKSPIPQNCKEGLQKVLLAR